MNKYTKENLAAAISFVSSSIVKCEKFQPKFEVGSSQHSLLKNRIKALYISKALLTNDNTIDTYTKDELLKALPPVTSIISKCEKANQKFEEGSTNYNRFKKMIDAMYIAKSLLTEEINKRG